MEEASEDFLPKHTGNGTGNKCWAQLLAMSSARFTSTHEKDDQFPLFTRKSTFTDDKVMTIAVAWAILRKADYAMALKEFGNRYPDAGYGGMFRRWPSSSSFEPKFWERICNAREPSRLRL